MSQLQLMFLRCSQNTVQIELLQQADIQNPLYVLFFFLYLEIGYEGCIGITGGQGQKS